MIEIKQGGKREKGLQEQVKNETKNEVRNEIKSGTKSEIQNETKNVTRSETKKAARKEAKKAAGKTSAASLQPKNFRQIGTPQGGQKVFIEDYVYTYLHPLEQNQQETRVCMLLGRVEIENDIHYIFVNGALELPEVAFVGSAPVFTERTREQICELVRQHFEGGTLVGWYLDSQGNSPCLTPELERIHRNFFGGKDKLLLLSDSLNREEKLFVCDNNAIWQKDGYYIYYEKNPQMQDYMISEKAKERGTIEPEKVVDEALKNYREILLKKDQPKPRSSRFVWYSAGFLVTLTVCALGINILQDRQKMESLESAIEVMANQWQSSEETETEELMTERIVVIESLEGNMSGTGSTEQDKLVPAEENETQTQGTDAQADSDVEADSASEQTSAMSQETDTTTPDAASQNAAESNTTTPDAISQDTASQGADTQSTDAQGTSTEQNQAEESQTAADSMTEPLSESETIRLKGYYIVQKGETLAAISRKIYNTIDMMPALCEKNEIENSDEIFAGQKLLLP